MEIRGLAYLFVAAFLFLCVFSFDPLDPTFNQAVSAVHKTNNLAGAVGSYTAGILVELFGVGALAWPLILAYVGISQFAERLRLGWFRWFGVGLLILCVMAWAAKPWALPESGQAPTLAGGGVIGKLAVGTSTTFLNSWGSVLCWLFLFAVSLQIGFQLSWGAIFKRLRSFLYDQWCKRRERSLRHKSAEVGKAATRAEADSERPSLRLLERLGERLSARAAKGQVGPEGKGDKPATAPASFETPGADMVLNAIVGSAGLEASLLAQEAGIPLALANKESLVVGGDLLLQHLGKGLVIPVDSEHSTIFRCLAGEHRPPARIVLTASGGALRDMPACELATASVERVLSHPNWSMGSRITVDSASMVNKAFEVIEARRLFPGIPVEVVVHPESIVHSLVETADGAWKALMGTPDMGLPISYALHWPALDIPETRCGDHPLGWGALHFRPVDPGRYPAYAAVLAAYDTGGTAPAAANAADEEAVRAFLSRRIPFGAVSEVISGVLSRFDAVPVTGFDVLEKADSHARQLARDVMEEM